MRKPVFLEECREDSHKRGKKDLLMKLLETNVYVEFETRLDINGNRTHTIVFGKFLVETSNIEYYARW